MPDIASVSGNPAFDESKKLHYKRNPLSKWKPGSGATSDEWKRHKKIPIELNGEGRSPVDNFRMLVTAIVPRPIGFVSTVSKDGKRNLAPFSYFAVVNHDPPIFTIGFSSGRGGLKDTFNNIIATGELTINIISDWFVEAASFACVDSPHGVDEWKLTGLTPTSSDIVKPAHVAESAFSVEAKLLHCHEWKSKVDPSRKTGELVIVEGVRFHVREDIINEEMTELDIAKLKPVAALGNTSFYTISDGYDIFRPSYEKDVLGDENVKPLLD